MKKALYRKRICAEKEKLTPEKVFHTPQYRDLLTSIGHEITGGKLTTLRLYDDKNSAIIPGSALSWFTTAKKKASAFMQI